MNEIYEYINSINADLYLRIELYSGEDHNNGDKIGYYNTNEKECAIQFISSRFSLLSEEEFKLVRKKQIPIKPITVEEAILQMNLLGHQFFAFRNQDEDNVFSIVYRRKNGGYGLISGKD